MNCLPKFPFKPLQPGYRFKIPSGIRSTKVPGGPSFSRLDTTGNPFSVTVSWVLVGKQYDLFMGHVRRWERSGGELFLIDLIIETSEMKEYQAKFELDSLAVDEKNGNVYKVSAQLEVLPVFVSACSDIWASRAVLDAYYGPVADDVIDVLSRVVNEDLVYVRA